MSKRMTINRNLVGEDGHNVYHILIADMYHVNMIPVIQRPSGRLTYTWATSGGRKTGQVFDDQYEARDHAMLTLGSR